MKILLVTIAAILAQLPSVTLPAEAKAQIEGVVMEPEGPLAEGMSSRLFATTALFIAIPTFALRQQQSVQFGNGKFQADRVETDGGVVRLRGSVRLVSTDLILEADEVDFDSRPTGNLEARGNVFCRPNPELQKLLDDKRGSLESLLATGRFGPNNPEVRSTSAAILDFESRVRKVEASCSGGSPLKIQIGQMLRIGQAGGKEQFLRLLEETRRSR